MKISTNPGRKLRSKIGKIGIALAFALVTSGVAAWPALAADHHGHGNQGGGQHRGNSGRDSHPNNGGGRGNRGYDNYYAPGPNYYSAPEPDYYYAPQPDYYPVQPSQGVNLFFGL